MSGKTVFTSGILLFALVAVSILLNQGLIRAFANGSGVSLETNASTYIFGEAVELTGVLTILPDDVESIRGVTLIVDGPDAYDLDVALPLYEVAALDLLGDPGATGSLLEVTVEFANLLPPGSTLPGSTLPNGMLPGGTLPNSTLPNGTLPGSTLPNSTLPNGTLPDTSCQLLGDTDSDLAQLEVVGEQGAITYSIDWIPSAAGIYRGYLVVTSVSADGCTTTSSVPVEFSVSIEPPPNPGDDKVTICHIPPGNPAKAHLITVGIPAVPAHLRHGDVIEDKCPTIDAKKKHKRNHGHDEDYHDDDDEEDNDHEKSNRGHGNAVSLGDKPDNHGKSKKSDDDDHGKKSKGKSKKLDDKSDNHGKSKKSDDDYGKKSKGKSKQLDDKSDNHGKSKKSDDDHGKKSKGKGKRKK